VASTPQQDGSTVPLARSGWPPVQFEERAAGASLRDGSIVSLAGSDRPPANSERVANTQRRGRSTVLLEQC